MLAAGDWVIYLIPVIAFLVYLLSTALRPQQPPPPVARPNRRTDAEPVIFPAGQSAPQDVPVVQPVSAPPQSSDRLKEFLERRRKQQRPSPVTRPRRLPSTPSTTVPVGTPERPAPVGPVDVPVEPVFVLPPSAIVAPPPPRAFPTPSTAGLSVSPATPEFRSPPAQATRRAPPPALVFISRYLQNREDLQAAFLLREILGPPKALQILSRLR